MKGISMLCALQKLLEILGEHTFVYGYNECIPITQVIEDEKIHPHKSLFTVSGDSSCMRITRVVVGPHPQFERTLITSLDGNTHPLYVCRAYGCKA